MQQLPKRCELDGGRRKAVAVVPEKRRRRSDGDLEKVDNGRVVGQGSGANCLLG